MSNGKHENFEGGKKTLSNIEDVYALALDGF